MALPELRGIGRLLTDPRNGISKNDKAWTSALIKFPTWHKNDDGWEEGEGTVASLIAFEGTAAALAGYRKGDQVGVHGTAKAAVWNDKPQIAVTVTNCWTPEKQARKPTQVSAAPAAA